MKTRITYIALGIVVMLSSCTNQKHHLKLVKVEQQKKHAEEVKTLITHFSEVEEWEESGDGLPAIEAKPVFGEAEFQPLQRPQVEEEVTSTKAYAPQPEISHSADRELAANQKLRRVVSKFNGQRKKRSGMPLVLKIFLYLIGGVVALALALFILFWALVGALYLFLVAIAQSLTGYRY